MAYDESNLIIRRLVVRHRYHAAYLLFSVVGALAERWGHDYFYAYSYRLPDFLQLMHKEHPRLAVFGLKETMILHECVEDEDDLRVKAEATLSILNDVRTTLRMTETVQLSAELTVLYSCSSWSNAFSRVKDAAQYTPLEPSLPTATHEGMRYMSRYKRGAQTIDLHVSPFRRDELRAEFRWTDLPEAPERFQPENSILVSHTYTMSGETIRSLGAAEKETGELVRLATSEGLEHSRNLLRGMVGVE